MFEFIKKLFSNKEDVREIENENLIHLTNYQYRIDEIYGNMIFVDVDVDTCDVENGHLVKVFNEIYKLKDVKRL